MTYFELFMKEPDNKIVIIDSGSYNTRIGYSFDLFPRYTFPTCLGLTNKEKFQKNDKKNKKEPKDEEEDTKEIFLGQDAIKRQYMCTIKYPINDYRLKDFPTYEKMIETVFEEKLFLKTDGISIVMTDPILSTQRDREKLCEIMFEKYNIGRYYVQKTPVFNLYSHGMTTGYSVDFSYTGCVLAPIFEGLILEESQVIYPYGGKYFDNYIWDMLINKNPKYDQPFYKSQVTKMREDNFFIANDYNKTKDSISNGEIMPKVLTLPDKSEIVLKHELINVYEQVFNPTEYKYNKDLISPVLVEELQLDDTSIQSSIFNSILQLDEEIRWEMFTKLVVTGGLSMASNLCQRLCKEIKMITPSKYNVNVYNTADRKNASWVGASVLCSIDAFNKLVLRKNEYEEDPKLFNLKCF